MNPPPRTPVTGFWYSKPRLLTLVNHVLSMSLLVFFHMYKSICVFHRIVTARRNARIASAVMAFPSVCLVL